MNDDIRHFGVKGMKWGVRKDRSAARKSRAEKRQKRARSIVKPSTKTTIKAVAAALAVYGSMRAVEYYTIHRMNVTWAKQAERNLREMQLSSLL